MDHLKIIKKDRNYELLTDDDVFNIIKQAVDVTKKVADKYDMKLINEYLQKRGFEIVYTKNNNEEYKYRARIDINNKSKCIYIYEDCINEDHKNFGIDKELLNNLYLAHEFFHLLEYDGIVNLEYYVSKKIFKFFNTKVKILAISEVGANYFASLVLDINFDITNLDKEIYEV